MPRKGNTAKESKSKRKRIAKRQAKNSQESGTRSSGGGGRK